MLVLRSTDKKRDGVTTTNERTTKHDCVVVGAGFAGATIARELAERGSKKVLVLDRRDHIGGNAYDCYNRKGILIHKYGPHIFHTNSRRAYEYMSRFTEWRRYEHRVLASIHRKLIPVPFNLNSVSLVFREGKAERVRKKLVDAYGINNKVGILELIKQADPDLRDLAEYIYRNIFLHYTEKQWGTRPEDIDPSVTARVPVYVSEDDRYFQDAHQGMPLDGYTALFNNVLDHPNIEVVLDTDARGVLDFDNGRISFRGTALDGPIVYTGAVDELFEYCYGRLPYRTLNFRVEIWNREWKQPCGTVNYTVDRPYTRITEFKHLTGQENKSRTAIMKEYPEEYHGFEGEIPYYPVVNSESSLLYERYLALARTYPRLHLLGRLAEYKYYNMDTIVEMALALADRLIADSH